jgi:hypothetical protein
MCLPAPGPTHVLPPNDGVMNQSELSPSAPKRWTRRGNDPPNPTESVDHDVLQVKKKGAPSQGYPFGGRPYTAAYPQSKSGRTHKDFHSRWHLGRVFPNPRNTCETSEKRTNDDSSEINCTKTNHSQIPKSIGQVSLTLQPIRIESIVNGSVVKNSKDMRSSCRSDYEKTGITDHGTAHLAPISTVPPPKSTEAPTSTSGEFPEKDLPETTTIKSLSRNDEIQLYDLLQRIHRLRESIWGLRSRVQEQRGVLRSKQYVKAAADDKYMQLARLKESGADKGRPLTHSEGKSLQELFQECERARAEYGPLEDDCNALEDQLGSEEYELTRLEEAFKKTCTLAIPHDNQPSSSEIVQDGRSERSSSDVVQNFHPLVTEYLSRLGDVDIFRERHERHLEEKEALESDRETRRRVNLTLSPEDEAWLQESDYLENEVLRDLQKAQTEAEELRKKCLTAGLLDENGEPKDFQTQEQEAFAEDVDANGEKSEYVKFPTLLPQPGTKDIKFKASAPRPGEQSGGAGDHINQWLLHSLRSSPLDVFLLAKTFEAKVGYFEAQKWEADVRDYWYKDGAVKDASGYRIDSIMSDTTPVYEVSKLSKESVHENKIEPVLGITGRKTAASDTSSVSGSEFFGISRDNEIAVDALPRSKYEGNGI